MPVVALLIVVFCISFTSIQKPIKTIAVVVKSAIQPIKAKAFNSIIIRTTKDTIEPNHVKVKEKLPLYVLNGAIISKKILDLISPEKIKNINVLKGNAATATYGEKGANGVIQITTKDFIEGEIQSDSTSSIFSKVEIDAEFPGGNEKWRLYLMKNLNTRVPILEGAKSGQYQVRIKFIVKKDGSVANVEALTMHGYGMEEEAMRVIKEGPKWLPAMQNGKEVGAFRIQPITFLVESKN